MQTISAVYNQLMSVWANWLDISIRKLLNRDSSRTLQIGHAKSVQNIVPEIVPGLANSTNSVGSMTS
jgi:hypothetical protein